MSGKVVSAAKGQSGNSKNMAKLVDPAANENYVYCSCTSTSAVATSLCSADSPFVSSPRVSYPESLVEESCMVTCT